MKDIVVHLRSHVTSRYFLNFKDAVMEQEAFRHLLIEQQAQLKAFAALLTQDDAEIADLCQETNFRALQNAGRFETGTNINGWLQTMMRHIFYNDFRRNRHLQNIKQQMARTQTAWPNSNFGSTGQEQPLSDLEEKQTVQRAFHALPSKLRIPFVLYFHGHAYRDISRLIRKPMGTVKNRIFKAKRQLSRILGRK